MTRSEMLTRLDRYPVSQTRCEYLDQLIPQLWQRLEQMKENALHGLGAGHGFDAVSRNTGFGDPTASNAMKAMDYALDQEMRQYHDRLTRLISEQNRLKAEITEIDCLLSALSEEERFLISVRCFEHTPWQQFMSRYAERYGYSLSTMTLRRRLYDAVDRMCLSDLACSA